MEALRRESSSDNRITDDTALSIAEDLRRRTTGEVRFDRGSRALYATDASNYRQIPIGVVLPRTTGDVIETVATCKQWGVPIVSRGAGTSLAGQTCNTAVIIDMSKYLNQVIGIDPQKRLARVQPGVILDHLSAQARTHGLTFGPDPATHEYCTLGGMIGNNSCGVHALMSGRTSENIEELHVLTYDGTELKVGKTSDIELERIIRRGGRRGEIYSRLKRLRDVQAETIRRRYPKIPRRVSGYCLDELLSENGFHIARSLVGSEGTCVIILEATIKLIPDPPFRTLLVLAYPDVFSAADHVPEILKLKPVGLEGMDDRLIGYMRKKGLKLDDLELLPEGGGWLIAEFGGQAQEESEALAWNALKTLEQSHENLKARVISHPQDQKRVWGIRESGLGATAKVPGERDTWPGWEDSAVSPEFLGNYLRELRKLYDRYGYHPALYGHFGQGCIHCRVDFDLNTKAGIAKFRSFMKDATDLVIKYGGSLSGEHGDGQARAELLEKMYGRELVHAFQEFKSIWDPEWKMNPGKIVLPDPMDHHLRIGVNYSPKKVKTYFKYPEDEKDFARATTRCVGVGKCRRLEGGLMCPSFMVTREEKHSTRGRARLLFEMLQSDSIQEGWKSDHVKDALDLCLACKGCKSDCPVNVDMATYKAEFLAHYHKTKPRPAAAYSMGLIFIWARFASRFPGLVNFVTQAPILRNWAKRMAGISSHRKLPKIASTPFRDWYFKRTPTNEGGSPVILWPDTFNNYFYPESAQAAVEVLESAGFQVLIPRRQLCCGRPLYDFGMLGLARKKLSEILSELKDEIRMGIPIVGLEPSCTAVFRDELGGLFPDDQDANRLKAQVFTLGEFVKTHFDSFTFGKLRRDVVIHGHCHQKAIMKLDAEKWILDKLGAKIQEPELGCCGMAGAFGFEDGKYEISQQIAERALLPAIRSVSAKTLVLIDGFSCREQVTQSSKCHPVHFAEFLKLSLDQSMMILDEREKKFG